MKGVMAYKQNRKRLPPYISYRTFRNFVIRLEEETPARIDRSYWGQSLSGSTGTQLMAALRFLELIDSEGRLTDTFKHLLKVRGEERRHVLQGITLNAFDFVFQGPLDIQRATYSQLEEVFNASFQLASDVCRKCIKFFIDMSSDAGITLSPFITKRGHSNRSIEKSRASRKSMPVHYNKPSMPSSEASGTSWQEMLLDKFPPFDPSWSNELKLSWIETFNELLKLRLSDTSERD